MKFNKIIKDIAKCWKHVIIINIIDHILLFFLREIKNKEKNLYTFLMS